MPDERAPGKLRARKIAFARAYGDPSSPTFNDVEGSYMAANPDASPKSARTSGYRLLREDPLVQETLAEMAAVNKTISGGNEGLEEYVDRLHRYQEMFANRGEKGDSGAVSRLMELEGKARGYFITKVEDLTPPERRGIQTHEQKMQLLQRAETVVNNMRALQGGNPLPKAISAVVVNEEIAEAVIEDEENDGEVREETAGAPEASADG